MKKEKRKKSTLDAFAGYIPPKEKTEPEWDVDELCGPPPRGYYRRMAWYKKMEKEEKK